MIRHGLTTFFMVMCSAGVTAQTQWVMEFDRPWVTPANPTVTVRLSAQFPPQHLAFGAAMFDLHATEPGWSNPVLLLPPPGDPGTISGSVITGIVVGQIHFPPVVIANPANPIAVYEVQWTATEFTPRAIDFRTQTQRYDVYPVGTGMPPRLLHLLVEGSREIRVVPVPATAWPVAIVSMVLIPRRRRAWASPTHACRNV